MIKTEGAFQAVGLKWARIALIGVIAFIAMVSIWTPLSDRGSRARWFTWPNLAYLAPLPIITGAIVWVAVARARRGPDYVPFFGAIGLFAMCFLGLGISLLPYIVPYSITLWEAASAPAHRRFSLVGTLLRCRHLHMYIGCLLCLSRQGHVAHGLPLNHE